MLRTFSTERNVVGAEGKSKGRWDYIKRLDMLQQCEEEIREKTEISNAAVPENTIRLGTIRTAKCILLAPHLELPANCSAYLATCSAMPSPKNRGASKVLRNKQVHTGFDYKNQLTL